MKSLSATQLDVSNQLSRKRSEGYLVRLYIGCTVCPRAVPSCACVDSVTVKLIITMRFFIITAAILAMAQARPGLFFTQQYQPIGVEYASPGLAAVYPHPAVELNAASEAQLPRGLLKSSQFYDNPHTAAGLARESWFTNKEMQVVEREAEKIPRESIYHIVKNAGFLDRH